jgi:pilus assembly protein CpaB
MNRRIVLIAVAVVLAVLGTVLVYSYAHNADERAVADGRAVKVLIANKRVPAGTSWADAVKNGTLSVQSVPASSRPNDALSSTDAGIAQTAVAQSDIAPGQIVLREAFGTSTPQTGVLTIPKGLIAITIGLSADNDVAGYVSPGAKVIIFDTAKLDLPQGTKQPTTYGDGLTVTRTIVPTALVIATSQAAPTNTVGSGNSNSSSSQSSVLVTIALTQQDAERVVNQKQNLLTLGLLSATSVIHQDGGYENSGVFDTTPIWVK